MRRSDVNPIVKHLSKWGAQAPFAGFNQVDSAFDNPTANPLVVSNPLVVIVIQW